MDEAVFKERFDSKWTTIPETGCWWWIAGITKFGYGQFWFRERHQKAHRVSYIFHVGEIPCGMFICHHCDNRCCFNPEHLFLGTHSDNMLDMHAKGRGANKKGSEHMAAKLSERDVREIRASTDTQRSLSKLYGVSHQHINSIKNGHRWQHLLQAKEQEKTS